MVDRPFDDRVFGVVVAVVPTVAEGDGSDKQRAKRPRPSPDEAMPSSGSGVPSGDVDALFEQWRGVRGVVMPVVVFLHG